MNNYLLTISYEGTNYCGYQVQKNGITVQEMLMKAGGAFLKEGFRITTASRTDAGVHAVGQRAMLTCYEEFKDYKLVAAFNAFLPMDIRLLKASRVANDFHPRYHARSKHYVYKIWNGYNIPPQYQRYCHMIRKDLDLDKMKEIAKVFVGRHDFDGFSSTKKTVKETIRTISICKVTNRPIETPLRDVGRLIEIDIEGDGFLYNMVRIIGGTIVKYGARGYSIVEGKRNIEEVFKNKDRKLIGQTLPAKGLTLVEIKYD